MFKEVMIMCDSVFLEYFGVYFFVFKVLREWMLMDFEYSELLKCI